MYRIFFAGALTLMVGLTQINAETVKDEPAVVASLEEAKTVEEVKAFLSNTSRDANIRDAKDPVVRAKLLAERGERLVAAGEKVFAIGKDDAEREEGLRMKLSGLKILKSSALVRENSEDQAESEKKLEAFVKELDESGKFPAIVNDEKFQLFYGKSSRELHENFTQEKFDQFVKELKQWSNKPLRVKPVSLFSIAIRLASSDEAQKVDPQLVEKTINDLAAFVKSEESTITEENKKDVLLQFEGLSKRTVGADPQLYGKTLDDKDFDWKSLRGKYVVVKFTASWCGPCKGEIPGLKKAYEAYHDKGLEIVSIYVWDKLDDSKKIVKEEEILWITLSEELTEKAGQSPQGKAYGVSGVPTMFIVDKDGKVLLTEARGEKLQTKLAELFAEKEQAQRVPASLIVPKP